ncbi:hypothetical protein CPB84DRAFT_1843503 [Gymnopilus junonius]|uniref:Uncharacterized protein n=1 Tax=Gymnopilus junonius TaxID=109634 RepID=A0A9P5TR43_GYMJU|nr:hypothetical protein CPB84DRAFT_1843503 [Gymnopilus junonius]
MDLQHDIDSVFNPERFLSKGYFFHTTVEPKAPNPCIKLRGHGVLGLPLNERDIPALALNVLPSTLKAMEDSTPHTTERTIADQIEFGIPLWNEWVEGFCKETYIRLGFERKSKRFPKMKFSRLQICRKNSSNRYMELASNDQTSVSAFGTVIILLPSEYSGRQLEVSHSSTTQTVDFSVKSPFMTALFACHKQAKVHMYIR